MFINGRNGSTSADKNKVKKGFEKMYSFDLIPDRRNSDSVKWNQTPEDVLAMWVADMDFCIPPAIEEAVKTRAAHLYYGYPNTEDHLKEIVAAHYEKTYQIKMDVDWIVLVPTVMPGVTTALKMLGGAFMYSIPMYNHIRMLTDETGLSVVEVPMKKDENCHYTMDIPAMEAALTSEVKAVILCNPHNPVGRMYSQEELEQLQEFCDRHGLLVISDEIHCELALEKKHIPYFAVNEKAAINSVTLSSAGKICNIPGLPMGFAIIPNPEIRKLFEKEQDGRVSSGNVLSLAAYEKAYDGSCDEWKDALREYLRENKNLVEERVAEMPGIKVPHNEGTYLAWLDCSALGLEDPAEFFLKEAKVQVSSGEIYGNMQCVRLNYGCPRAQLAETLDRIEAAVSKLR